MKIKEFRAILEERVEDLEMDMNNEEDERYSLLYLGKIGAYRMILDYYLEMGGYVPKHGRE